MYKRQFGDYGAWLQKEADDGKLVVAKVVGEENPADLMTKVLGLSNPNNIQGRWFDYCCPGKRFAS